MTERTTRLLAAFEAEIERISKLEHRLARTKRLLHEQATQLRLGADAEVVMTVLRRMGRDETTLAVLERVDPVLSAPTGAVVTGEGPSVKELALGPESAKKIAGDDESAPKTAGANPAPGTNQRALS